MNGETYDLNKHKGESIPEYVRRLYSDSIHKESTDNPMA